MKNFILRLITFFIITCLIGEFIIRVYKLTPDIPQRFIDETGIQRYKPEQTGYYTKSDTKWRINKYGWMGVADTTYGKTIAVIGDSYIENIMNPISCNQGVILKSYFDDIGFFEAGRSGVSFIEGMEITKLLKPIIQPQFYLLYVSSNDFYESFSNKIRYFDRMQIDLKNKTILKAKLKNPTLKKFLYSSKLLYYMYLRFPLLVENQNKGEIITLAPKNNTFDQLNFNKLFEYSVNNYDVEKIILIFHPGTQKEIISTANEYGFQTVELNSEGDQSWGLGSHDGHWSCYGHSQVAKQVKTYLNTVIVQ